MLHFWRKSRTKRWFWSWRITFGGSLARFGDLALHFCRNLVRNARFGDLAFHFWRKSHEPLVLETWRFTFLEEVAYETLVLALFWRKPRTKRWFWRLGASLLEEVSYETLVLETWRFTCGAGLRPGANVLRERAFRSWTQKWPVCSTNVVRERACRRWIEKWPVVVQM